MGASKVVWSLRWCERRCPFRDVTPLSLGTETMSGVFKTHRPQHYYSNMRLECFLNCEKPDNQPAVDITFFKVNAQWQPDNKTLGRFQLTDIQLHLWYPTNQVKSPTSIRTVSCLFKAKRRNSKEQTIVINQNRFDRQKKSIACWKMQANAEADKKQKK